MRIHLREPPMGREHPSTNRTTLRSRLKSITTANLPQQFKDAIYLTRHLGVRYLWIDSFCIIRVS